MSDEAIAPARRKWAILLVAAAAMVALAVVLAAMGPKAKERALVNGAQGAAAAKLRDPSSAQFRNIRITGSHVCGEINGKNGYGAYSGFVRFHGDKDSAEVDPGNAGPTFNGEPVMKTSFEASYRIWCGS